MQDGFGQTAEFVTGGVDVVQFSIANTGVDEVHRGHGNKEP